MDGFIDFWGDPRTARKAVVQIWGAPDDKFLTFRGFRSRDPQYLYARSLRTVLNNLDRWVEKYEDDLIITFVPECSSEEALKIVRTKDKKYYTCLNKYAKKYLESIINRDPIFYKENAVYEYSEYFDTVYSADLYEDEEKIIKPTNGKYDLAIRVNRPNEAPKVKWKCEPKKGLITKGTKPVPIVKTPKITKSVKKITELPEMIVDILESDLDNISKDLLEIKAFEGTFDLALSLDISCLNKGRVKNVIRGLRDAEIPSLLHLNKEKKLILDILLMDSDLFKVKISKAWRKQVQFFSENAMEFLFEARKEDMFEEGAHWRTGNQMYFLDEVLAKFSPQNTNEKVEREKQERYWLNTETILKEVPNAKENLVYIAYFEHSKVLKIGRTENWTTRESIYSRENGKHEDTNGTMTLLAYKYTKSRNDIHMDKFLMFCSEDLLKKFANESEFLSQRRRKTLGIEYYDVHDPTKLEEFCESFSKLYDKITEADLVNLRNDSKIREFAYKKNKQGELLLDGDKFLEEIKKITGRTISKEVYLF